MTLNQAMNSPIAMTNTEMRATPPDVDDYAGPLKTRCLDLVARLRSRHLTVDDYQREAASIMADPALAIELAAPIARALLERRDQVFYRRQDGPRRTTLQLLYLAPHEVHPPHCHHNLISNQMNVHGHCHVREFDRVARLSDNRLLLRLANDAWFGPNDLMQTTEVYRNAHWFAADASPCVVLNFYLLGFHAWTFDPAEVHRRKGRQCLDPTVGRQEDGLIIADEVDFETGYAKFAGRSLESFALP